MKRKSKLFFFVALGVILALVILPKAQSEASADGINIALNPSGTGYPNPLESNNGWGCCPNKWAMIDGAIAAPSWSYGFAWGGGTRHWNGESCGWKQATVNFGEPKTFNRTVTYHHGQGHVPTEYKIQYWDGSNWIDAISVANNTTCQESDPNYTDNCPLDDTFSPVTASKVRYTFDQNCEITDGTDWRYVEHGWIREFEVYGFTYTNQPPIADAGGPYTVNEGDSVTLDASASTDPDNNIASYEWDLDNDGAYDDAAGVTTDMNFADDGVSFVGLKVTDAYDESDTDTAEITVVNVAPTIESLTAPVDPLKVGVPVETSATFTDPGVLDTHTATWNWGDGSANDGVVDGYNVSGSHIYNAPGVYTVSLTVADDDSGSDTKVFQYVVIYDPDGGFVTGGGWIWSPEGAYTRDLSLTGKATFGFVSKYQKGANVPTGNTEFQFKVADLNFKSTSYDWLVIAGSKAQYKGTGTINGAGEYGFMLTATDGSPDMFRIKIWDQATGAVIYDNQLGAADDTNPTTAIQGGSIVIHKPK